MLLKALGMRLYITDVTGTPFPEYQEKQTNEGNIECWIPSIEGVNFEIHWEIIERTPITAGCCSCVTPYFDGVKLSGKVASSGKGKGKLYGHPVGITTVRLYQFTKRRFTATEDTSLSDTIKIEELGTIRLKVDWGQRVLKRRSPHRFSDTNPAPGLVPENLAKQGFWDAAELGPATDTREQKFLKFVKSKDAMSGSFLFRYASEDVLRAQGIITSTRKLKSSTKLDHSLKYESSGAGPVLKRLRSATPEAAQFETLEDEGSKLLAPSAKRRKPGDSVESQAGQPRRS
ncbi:hypothetical protein OPQ81_006147 [Rhizoctonia solani]|nr:hypothetical protein OPQ81_006147 [Rhizoctonia solani]